MMPLLVSVSWFRLAENGSIPAQSTLLTNQVIKARFIGRTMELRAVPTIKRDLMVSLTNSFQVGIDLEATIDFKEWKPFLKHSESNMAPFKISTTNGHQLFLRSVFRAP